jgi:hypothetical protein
MLITDHGSKFSTPDPGSRVKKIPDTDPHPIFNPKKCSYAHEKISWDVQPGSLPDLGFGSRIQRSKKHCSKEQKQERLNSRK